MVSFVAPFMWVPVQVHVGMSGEVRLPMPGDHQ